MWKKGGLPDTLRPRQNGRHNPDNIFKCIFVNENAWISLKISLMFIPKVRINNIPALVLIMAWRRPGDKLLVEPMLASLLTHICVTGTEWVQVEGYNESYELVIKWSPLKWYVAAIKQINDLIICIDFFVFVSGLTALTKKIWVYVYLLKAHPGPVMVASIHMLLDQQCFDMA